MAIRVKSRFCGEWRRHMPANKARSLARQELAETASEIDSLEAIKTNHAQARCATLSALAGISRW